MTSTEKQYDGMPRRRYWLTHLMLCLQELNRHRHAAVQFVRRCYWWVRRLPAETYMNLTMPLRLWQVRYYIRYVERNAHRIGTRPRKPGEAIGMMVISQLPRDPRVERAAKTLAQHGHRIRLICPKWQGLDTPPVPPKWGQNITTLILPPSTSSYRFPYLFDRQMYQAAVQSGAWAYHCHDLSTCLIGLAAAAKTGAHVVCDFHEWYSETVSWYRWRKEYGPHPASKRNLFRRVEALCLQHASRVVTVCDSLAEQIQYEFQAERELTVVRNIPFIQRLTGPVDCKDLREEIKVGKDYFILLYQGGVGPSRGIEPIIEALAKVPKVVLVIRGPSIGQYEREYLRLANRCGVGHRVFCLDPVPSTHVVAEASTADAGIYTVKDLCINFRFALPNKLFEYLAAGLPVLAADYPEVRKIVDRYEVGVLFDAASSNSIALAISRLVHDKELRERCKQNIPAVLEAQRADVEWLKMVTLYDTLTPSERQAAA